MVIYPFFAGKIINLIDRLLEKYRLLKRYIVSLKIHFNLFLEKKSFSKVALVPMPGTSMKVIGFVTSEEVEEVIHSLKDHVAVYVPQTFQVAGFTF